jgi:hypothetical protein
MKAHIMYVQQGHTSCALQTAAEMPSHALKVTAGGQSRRSLDRSALTSAIRSSSGVLPPATEAPAR